MANGWWKTAAGGWLNPDMVMSVYTEQSGTDWRVTVVQSPNPSVGIQLEGNFTSKADADEAAEDLVNGITLAQAVG